jgi:hypothetical protein
MALMLAAPWIFRLLELRTRRGWRRIGERYGLRVHLGDLARSLRGVVDGIDVDVVFQRWTDSAQTTMVAPGDGAATSHAASGLVLRAEPVEGCLDPQADGPRLRRLRALGRLQLAARGARWIPRRGGGGMSPRRLEAALRLFLAAVDEARVHPGGPAAPGEG